MFQIDERLGAAVDALDALMQENGPGSFDFAFIGEHPLLPACQYPVSHLGSSSGDESPDQVLEAKKKYG